MLIRYDCVRLLGSMMLVARSSRGVLAVAMGSNASVLIVEVRERFPVAELRRDAKGLRRTIAAIRRAIREPDRPSSLRLDLHGTRFQQRVWRALRRIPPGERLSYSHLATRIGKPRAARAVASACAKNPIAVLVPCHRVICRSGSLGGYRWGIRRKRSLLKGEMKHSKNPSSFDILSRVLRRYLRSRREGSQQA